MNEDSDTVMPEDKVRFEKTLAFNTMKDTIFDLSKEVGIRDMPSFTTGALPYAICSLEIEELSYTKGNYLTTSFCLVETYERISNDRNSDNTKKVLEIPVSSYIVLEDFSKVEVTLGRKYMGDSFNMKMARESVFSNHDPSDRLSMEKDSRLIYKVKENISPIFLNFFLRFLCLESEEDSERVNFLEGNQWNKISVDEKGEYRKITYNKCVNLAMCSDIRRIILADVEGKRTNIINSDDLEIEEVLV